MHRSPWIEVSLRWIHGDDDATAFGLHHVIPQGLRHRIERQHSAGKALDELQPAYCLPLLRTYRAISLVGHVLLSVLRALTMLRAPNAEAAASTTRNRIAGRAARWRRAGPDDVRRRGNAGMKFRNGRRKVKITRLTQSRRGL